MAWIWQTVWRFSNISQVCQNTGYLYIRYLPTYGEISRRNPVAVWNVRAVITPPPHARVDHVKSYRFIRTFILFSVSYRHPMPMSFRPRNTLHGNNRSVSCRIDQHFILFYFSVIINRSNRSTDRIEMHFSIF